MVTYPSMNNALNRDIISGAEVKQRSINDSELKVTRIRLFINYNKLNNTELTEPFSATIIIFAFEITI